MDLVLRLVDGRYVIVNDARPMIIWRYTCTPSESWDDLAYEMCPPSDDPVLPPIATDTYTDDGEKEWSIAGLDVHNDPIHVPMGIIHSTQGVTA